MACVPPPASPDRGANREGNFQKLRDVSFVFALSCERQITAQSGHDQLRFGKQRQRRSARRTLWKQPTFRFSIRTLLGTVCVGGYGGMCPF